MKSEMREICGSVSVNDRFLKVLQSETLDCKEFLPVRIKSGGMRRCDGLVHLPPTRTPGVRADCNVLCCRQFGKNHQFKLKM